MGAVKKILASVIVIAFTVVGGLLGGPIGAMIGSLIGTALVSATLLKPNKKGATQEQAKSIVRLPEATRWLAAGRVRVGGAVVFAEFDAAGNLWYVVVHADSILTNIVQRYFDDVPITVDGGGNVTTNDFCLDSKKNPFQSGTKVPYFRIWTTTYDASDPTPPGIAELIAALPTKWTSDHKLVGTTYTVVQCKAIDDKYRSNIYKWRGVLGLGEPGFTLVADWSKVYDPRDETQTLGDPTTYKFSRNAQLLWAWFRTHPYGRNKSEDSINWEQVGSQATICDVTVTGAYGDHIRYQCGIAIPENRERNTAEQQIMATCDGQLVFDDEGKSWVRAGYFYAPSVALSRNRDIVAMESIEATNGESETQGVIVRYTDPDADYTMQPSAPWYNPNYYIPGQGVTFMTVEIEGVTDHNQAMRLAKAIGLRAQPLQKLAPMVGLRGLKARQERIVNIDYDNEFAGDYEIYSPVEVDASGQFVSFACVPVNTNRWSLLMGEEKPKPVIDGEGGIPFIPMDLPNVTSLVYNNGRIEAVFDPALRADVQFQFQYILTADIANDTWSDMVVQMNELFAYSGVVVPGDYSVQYRTVSVSGVVTDWIDPPVDVGVPAPPVTGLQLAILNSWIVEVSAGTPVVSIASDGTLTIDDNTRRYPDGYPDVEVDGDVIATGLVPTDVRSIAYDDPDRLGGAVTYTLYEDDNDAHVSETNPGRHYMGYFTVPASGSSGGGGGGVGGGREPNLPD